jgi:tetratricopeptide (TPR) repeat protein
VGWFHYRLGEYAIALDFCQRALKLQREIGARYDQADTLDSLARAHYQLGHDEQAVCCHQEAMQLYKEFGHRYFEADEFVMIGDVHLTAGRVDWLVLPGSRRSLSSTDSAVLPRIGFARN